MDTKLFLNQLFAYLEISDRWNESNLATEAGLANSTIRRWREGASTPRMQTAEKICNVLGTTLNEFISNKSDPAFLSFYDLWLQLTESEKDFLKNSAKAQIAARDHSQN